MSLDLEAWTRETPPYLMERAVDAELHRMLHDGELAHATGAGGWTLALDTTRAVQFLKRVRARVEKLIAEGAQ